MSKLMFNGSDLTPQFDDTLQMKKITSHITSISNDEADQYALVRVPMNLLNTFSYTHGTVDENGKITSSDATDAREWTYANSDFYVTLTPGKYTVSVDATTFPTIEQANIVICKTNDEHFLWIDAKKKHSVSFEINETIDFGIQLKSYTCEGLAIALYKEDSDRGYIPYSGSVIKCADPTSTNPTRLYKANNFVVVKLNNGITQIYNTFNTVLDVFYGQNEASNSYIKSMESLSDRVNDLNENLTIDGDYKFKVGKDGDGNVCYYGADGSLIPFKSKSGGITPISGMLIQNSSGYRSNSVINAYIVRGMNTITLVSVNNGGGGDGSYNIKDNDGTILQSGSFPKNGTINIDVNWNGTKQDILFVNCVTAYDDSQAWGSTSLNLTCL